MQVTAAFEPALVARSLEPMVAFYRDVLGMALVSIQEIPAPQAQAAGLSDQGYTIARLDSAGGDRLKIVVPRCALPPGGTVRHVLDRPGFSYLTFLVPDVRAVIARLRDAGITPRTGGAPVAFRPGVVELAFVDDPEGNCIEFVERNDLATYRHAQEGVR